MKKMKTNYAYVEKNTISDLTSRWFVFRAYGVGYDNIYLHKDGIWRDNMLPWENSYCKTRKEARVLAKKHNGETVIRSPRLHRYQGFIRKYWAHDKLYWLCIDKLAEYVDIPSGVEYIWVEASKQQWKDNSGIEVNTTSSFRGSYSTDDDKGYLCTEVQNKLRQHGFIKSGVWTTIYFRVLY